MGRWIYLHVHMPIPRPYQLSNGIFVPINIENGHGRLCPLFWGCTLLLLICGHIYIQTSSALQCQNHISNIYFVEVWQENGEEAYQKVALESQKHIRVLSIEMPSTDRNMNRLGALQSWKGRVWRMGGEPLQIDSRSFPAKTDQKGWNAFNKGEICA